MDVIMDSLTKLDKYPARQHAQRVAEALGVKEGLIYLRGAPAELLEDSDQGQVFRQRRYFFYLSGCNEKDCHLTYDIAAKKLTLWLAPFTVRDVVWMGRGSTIDEAESAYDISSAEYADKLEDFLAAWPASKTIFALHDQPSHLPPATKKAVNTTALLPATDYCRQIKDPHEVALIAEANRISTLAHTAVLTHVTKFVSEAQVAALYLGTCIANGAPVQAYSPIAGAGANGAVLHYGANNMRFGSAQSMVLDAGAEFELYASDVTRSFPLSGYWSQEGQAIYDLVADMQASAMAMLGPGKSMAAANAMCHVKATQGLKDLGILVGETDELLKAGVSIAFFPHGLGHHVGLEVHDVPNIRPSSMAGALAVREVLGEEATWWAMQEEMAGTRAPCRMMDEALKPGMVVTVEPGIYFSRYALENLYKPHPVIGKLIDWDVLEAFYAVGGVRIEDDILITERGWRNLTTAPKGEDALRIIRGE